MLHLPFAENRIAQFAARFVALPTGGWAWHPNDREAGLLVTAAEYPGLIERHSDLVLRANRVVGWWLSLSFIALIALTFAHNGELSRWWGLLVAAPVPWALWQWHRADRLPMTDNPRRMAVAPPRGIGAGAVARLAAMPWQVPLMMVVIGSLLLFQTWGNMLIQKPHYGVISIGLLVFAAMIIWLKLRR